MTDRSASADSGFECGHCGKKETDPILYASHVKTCLAAKIEIKKLSRPIPRDWTGYYRKTPDNSMT